MDNARRLALWGRLEACATCPTPAATRPTTTSSTPSSASARCIIGDYVIGVEDLLEGRMPEDTVARITKANGGKSR
jgi:hypothetical protein